MGNPEINIAISVALRGWSGTLHVLTKGRADE